MSTPSAKATRKTRSTSATSNAFDDSSMHDDLHSSLQSPTQFTQTYHQYFQSIAHRSILFNAISNLLTTENLNQKISLFILECLTSNPDYLSDVQFKQDLLPFFKRICLKKDENDDILLGIIRLLIALVEYRPNILSSTITEWLTCLLNFLATNLTSTTYIIYGDLTLDLLAKVIKQYSPLTKEIIEILSRSSLMISTNFLQQLKSWIQNTDDIRLGLFTVHLWESVATLLSRLIIRGHAKGNEILAVIEDAFIVSNYSIRSAAFTTWSSFMLHIQQLDDFESPQINNRLLKLLLTPFLSDSTSKSKSASISKCHSWITLISLYPKNINDVILPFLSFAFGNHISSKTNSTTTAWWSECRQIGAQYLHDLLVKSVHGEYTIKMAGDQILNYLFDSIVDQLLDYKIHEVETHDNSLWLTCWNAYLNHLINIFKTNNAIHDKQRVAINTCLLTRMEQLWIDSRIETRSLLKLFGTFEQIGFPLAVETVLRDSSIRTKTLSAAQIHPSSNNHRSQEKSVSHCTTLSDQCLHMMLEHAIRFNDEDQTIEDAYLHVITYLIDTLSKTSDENFCYQTSSLLLKCSVELSHQPIIIPCLFWHVWFRCSTHLISILNRSYTFELNNKIDNQKQETAIELLLRPFSFNDIQRLDYSYTLLWVQLFKALCRLALINNDQSKSYLINLLAEILRNEPAFEQAINDQHNQRLFGFVLIIIKTLLKTLSDVDLTNTIDRSNNNNNNFVYLLSNTQKRSLPSSSIILCLTQISMIVNHVLQRLLTNNENSLQYVYVACCLSKTSKISSNEQTRSCVFTFIRDVIVDLLAICKIYVHIEIILKNLTQLIPFLHLYEQVNNVNLTVGSSPAGISKQSTDNVILNKILTIISLVFEPSNSSSLLQLIYPLLILAFRHSKALMRNKARKCWNETFGRLKFIVYPNELRLCLRELKEKEHFLLPCFLADHDNSNTAGSGPAPSSNDESQLSQQVDIVTPLIPPTVPNQQSMKPSSPARFLPPPVPPIRSSNVDKNEPVYVPIMNNINCNNQSDVPVLISKRPTSISNCLTEKQKEKLRKRQSIPLLYDDNSNTQSNSCTVDSPTIENMMINYGLRNEHKQIVTSTCLFKQTIAHPTPEDNSTAESEANVNETTTDDMEEVPEESSITKKLRRSCRPSISARKSLVDNAKKKRLDPSVVNELVQTATIVPSDIVEKTSDETKKNPIKSILKRLSPTKPRQDHTRRVVFHDQVKVVVFASPSRRDLNSQLKKKGPNKDETKFSTRTIPKENLPLRKQSITTKSLNVTENNKPAIVSSPMHNNSKTRSSKLFHPNDAIADWTQTSELCQSSVKPSEKDSCVSYVTLNDEIYPNLMNCNKSIEDLLSILYDNACPTNTIEYFHSRNINTIGDIARLTANQIESSPIPSPKLDNIRKAFSLYEENLTKSPSVSPPIDNTGDCSLPVATTSDDIIANNNPSSPTEMVTNQTEKLYDVETLIESLDYEKLYLNNETPSNLNETNFLRTRHHIAPVNRQEYMSPQKRRLSPINNENDHRILKTHIVSAITLGDRLQKAADIYKMKGMLPFDDDYIELVRQLFNNSSLTHLERLHLKTLLLDQ